jgi:hypothetical protein
VAAFRRVPKEDDMLKLAWYLITDRDYWADADIALPAPVAELTGTLRRLFSDEAPFTPAHTATAADIMLQMAGYLCDAVRHGPATVPHRAAVVRLLHAINVLLAYLAQTMDRLADQIATGTGAHLSSLGADEQAKLATTLAAATSRLEDTADLIKQAHLTARSALRMQ